MKVKKAYIALALAVLMAGLALAHETPSEAVVDDDWHFDHMISHHGSLSEWFEDHVGLGRMGYHMGQSSSVGRGCH